MISVKQVGNEYFISFRYDPELINLVKQVPNRKWDSLNKCWIIHKNYLGFFLNQVKGTKYESSVVIDSQENININASFEFTPVIPNVDISKVPFYIQSGCQPYNHQKDFMKYAIGRQMDGLTSGFILCDEQGLGKTVEGLNLALYNRAVYGFKHCLIICCVNSGKYNWVEDIKRHTNGQEEAYILGTRFKRDKVTKKYDTGNKEKLKDLELGRMYGDESAPELPYFLVMNIEAIRVREKKAYLMKDMLLQYINDGLLNMVIIDEIHKNASPRSKQGQQILDIKRKAQKPVLWLPMTGTPITNRPTDIFLPLRLVDGHRYNSFYLWSKEYCIEGGYGGHDLVGYKNIPQLKRVFQSNMLRRLKQDVLDLPPKIRYTEYVYNSKKQQDLYDKYLSQLKEERESVVSSMNPLVRFLKLRQINGAPELIDDTISIDSKYLTCNAKLCKLLELLDEIVNVRGEKVIVFSNWVEPLRTLYRFISTKYKTCCFTGTMSAVDREKHKRVFLTNPEYKVMVGTIGALGTTHTLTAANNVIFYDEPWTPSDKEQAEDRIHRIGARSSSNIYTIITRDTVDERVHEILYKKQGIANFIVDNHLNIRDNPKLFDVMVGTI